MIRYAESGSSLSPQEVKERLGVDPDQWYIAAKNSYWRTKNFRYNSEILRQVLPPDPTPKPKKEGILIPSETRFRPQQSAEKSPIKILFWRKKGTS